VAGQALARPGLARMGFHFDGSPFSCPMAGSPCARIVRVQSWRAGVGPGMGGTAGRGRGRIRGKSASSGGLALVGQGEGQAACPRTGENSDEGNSRSSHGMAGRGAGQKAGRGRSGAKISHHEKRGQAFRPNPLSFLEPARRLELLTC